MMHSVTVAPYGAVATFVRTKLGWSGLAPDSPATGLAGAFLELSPGHGLIGWFDGRLDTLTHECVHAGLYFLGRAGINPMDSQGEALAYLVEWLFTQARTKN